MTCLSTGSGSNGFGIMNWKRFQLSRRKPVGIQLPSPGCRAEKAPTAPCRPDWFVTANPANGCESHCWRDLNLCTDVSLLAAFTPRKAPNHAGKPLEHSRPTKLGPSECLFAPGLRHALAGVLEEDARPATVGFELIAHLRIDDRAARPRGCEPTWRFAFPHLAAHHDPVEAGLGVRRHAKPVALGRRQILRTVG